MFGVIVQVILTEAIYWKADSPEHFSKENFPAFIALITHSLDYYGIPIHEYPGLFKVLKQ